jgi:YesN/AraC family two-component response regulator
MPSRLLIVDDDPTLLMALPDTIRLHLRDSVIETATSGHAALEQIKAVDYDAIVTDIKMPGMDGLSLMQ